MRNPQMTTGPLPTKKNSLAPFEAPDKSPYVWDQRLRRGAGAFRDTATGRIVTTTQATEALFGALDEGKRGIVQMGQLLQNGTIDLQSWQRGMLDHIMRSHTNAYSLAAGGYANMTAADKAALEAVIDAQRRYLENFAREIADGTVKLDGAFLVRAQMYEEAAHITYEGALRDRAMSNLAITAERNVLDPYVKEHCRGCLAQAALGWVPKGTLLPIGSRDCRVNDRCTIEYAAAQDVGVL